MVQINSAEASRCHRRMGQRSRLLSNLPRPEWDKRWTYSSDISTWNIKRHEITQFNLVAPNTVTEAQYFYPQSHRHEFGQNLFNTESGGSIMWLRNNNISLQNYTALHLPLPLPKQTTICEIPPFKNEHFMMSSASACIRIPHHPSRTTP